MLIALLRISCLQEEDTEEDSREQVKGEALLLRAYTHFDLLNLYGKPYKPGICNI